MSEPGKVGWWNPRPFDTRARFHYIGEDGRSLCGRWALLFGTVDSDEMDEHPDNCGECRKRVKARRAAAAAAAVPE